MMKQRKFLTKTFLILTIFITVFSGSFSFVSAAHKGSVESNAGLTPASPVYFIDEFFDDVRLFFAFNKEVKALLHVDLISERLSEIEAMLSKREEVSESQINTGEEKIKYHISSIVDLLKEIESDGDEVGELAKRIDKSFEDTISHFDEDIDHLVSESEGELENIKERITSDSKKITGVERNNFDEIRRIVDDIRFMESNADEIRFNIRKEEERIEEFMLDINKVKNDLVEVEGDFKELRSEADENNLELPSGYFMTFSYFDFIDNAKTKVDNLNFPEAAKSIENARDSVSSFRDVIQNAKESKFKKYESEVTILEAEESFSKIDEISTELKNSYTRFISQAKAEFNAGNYQKAKDLAKQAKEVIIKES